MDAVSSGHADTSIRVREEKKHILDNDLPQFNNEKRGKEIISFEVEMRLKAARNERHVKPSAEPWHSLLTLRTPVLLLLLSARFSFLFFPPQCMTWPAQPRLGWIVQFHTCLLCWHLSEHIFPASTFPLTLFCISSTPIRRVSPPPPLSRGRNTGDAVGLRRPCFKTCHWVQVGN